MDSRGEIVRQGCLTYEKGLMCVENPRTSALSASSAFYRGCFSKNLLWSGLIQLLHAGVQEGQCSAELGHTLLQQIDRSFVHALLQQGRGLVE